MIPSRSYESPAGYFEFFSETTADEKESKEASKNLLSSPSELIEICPKPKAEDQSEAWETRTAQYSKFCTRRKDTYVPSISCTDFLPRYRFKHCAWCIAVSSESRYVCRKKRGRERKKKRKCRSSPTHDPAILRLVDMHFLHVGRRNGSAESCTIHN